MISGARAGGCTVLQERGRRGTKGGEGGREGGRASASRSAGSMVRDAWEDNRFVVRWLLSWGRQTPVASHVLLSVWLSYLLAHQANGRHDTKRTTGRHQTKIKAVHTDCLLVLTTPKTGTAGHTYLRYLSLRTGTAGHMPLYTRAVQGIRGTGSIYLTDTTSMAQYASPAPVVHVEQGQALEAPLGLEAVHGPDPVHGVPQHRDRVRIRPPEHVRLRTSTGYSISSAHTRQHLVSISPASRQHTHAS